MHASETVNARYRHSTRAPVRLVYGTPYSTLPIDALYCISVNLSGQERFYLE